MISELVRTWIDLTIIDMKERVYDKILSSDVLNKKEIQR